MAEYLVRIVLYTVLPVVTAAIVSRMSGRITSRPQRVEVYLVFLFGLGVAGSGISNAIAHFFLSDMVAEAIGWAPGNPFQLEIAFANLALGVLGFIAVGRRDGFREATVIAVTVFSVGATIVHVIDIVQTGNLAPGNTWQNIINLARPALLIGFLGASRKSGADDKLTPAERIALYRSVGWMTGAAAGGFGLGFGIGQPVLGAVAGVVAGGIAVFATLRRRAGG